jgi:hypothetical protein
MIKIFLQLKYHNLDQLPMHLISVVIDTIQTDVKFGDGLSDRCGRL